MAEDLMTTEEICQWLKVQRRTIEKWRKEKGLPFLKIGKSVRFEKSAVEKWIKENSKQN